jgi:hypothetical protein
MFASTFPQQKSGLIQRVYQAQMMGQIDATKLDYRWPLFRPRPNKLRCKI